MAENQVRSESLDSARYWTLTRPTPLFFSAFASLDDEILNRSPFCFSQGDDKVEEVNPHIPQFMSKAPWYLQQEQPGLGHLKNWKEGQGDDEGSKKWRVRTKTTFQAKKYRKGACENCGSMTHKKADCLERPRQVGAKHSNKNIAADEFYEGGDHSTWDAKRDRWSQFQQDDYARVVERFERMQELKLKAEMQRLMEEEKLSQAEAEQLAQQRVKEQLDEDAKLDDKDTKDFSKVERRVRTGGGAGGTAGAIRNLRIREDTAKYLLNLDLDSAYYDPKSRSMRMDPNPEKDGKVRS